MLAVILVVGPIQDGPSGSCSIANTFIGIVQELRAKRTLDQLAVLERAAARAVRDGQVGEIAVEEIVLDDLLELRSGDQVPVRREVPLGRRARDRRVAAHRRERPGGQGRPATKCCRAASSSPASGRFQATRVGPDAYAGEAGDRGPPVHSSTRSELMDGINTILRIVTWVTRPHLGLAHLSQLSDNRARRRAALAPWRRRRDGARGPGAAHAASRS